MVVSQKIHFLRYRDRQPLILYFNYPIATAKPIFHLNIRCHVSESSRALKIMQIPS